MSSRFTKLKIGSRDSSLALIQSEWVRRQINAKYPSIEIEIIKIKTQGDKILDTPLSKIGDKGLFTKELEIELLNGSIDLAVHSMKDLPTRLPSGLEIAATSVREDVADVLCLSEQAQQAGIRGLESAQTLATSSLRRIAQIKRLYPHLNIKDIRGNLQTRFAKLDNPENELDGIILAAAGIQRLAAEIYPEKLQRISLRFNPQELLPAVGQGALGIEINNQNTQLKEFLREVINDSQAEFGILAERALLRSLEGGCQIPIGAYSEFQNDEYKLTAMVANLDGSQYLKQSISGELVNAEALGYQLAEDLLKAGAGEILASVLIR